MLLSAAALDLTRCYLIAVTVPQGEAAVASMLVGLAAVAVTLWTARGCQRGARWSGWAAFLIGMASAPQAAASGFNAAYTIPDTATAALGILIAVAVLATAGDGRRPGPSTGNMESSRSIYVGTVRPNDAAQPAHERKYR
jgi:hypothetical protein